MDFRHRISQLTEQACAEQQTLHDRLPEEARSRIGEPDCWAPKDQIDHVTGWNRRLAEQLEAAAQGQPLPNYSDYEEINAHEFAEHRCKPWPEILSESREACAQLVRRIEALSEEQLRGGELFPWLEGRPLWRSILGGTYVHAMNMHLGPIYLELAEKTYAIGLAEQGSELLAELDEADDWQGLVRYNLACSYALAGEKGKALEALREGLRLNPGLTDWSKEDPDLISLHDEAGYQALYAG